MHSLVLIFHLFTCLTCNSSKVIKTTIITKLDVYNKSYICNEYNTCLSNDLNFSLFLNKIAEFSIFCVNTFKIVIGPRAKDAAVLGTNNLYFGSWAKRHTRWLTNDLKKAAVAFFSYTLLLLSYQLFVECRWRSLVYLKSLLLALHLWS